MKSKFTKLLATALVLCLVLALLPAAAFADSGYYENYNNLGINVQFFDLDGNSDEYGTYGSVVIDKGSGDNQYVITATPSSGYGLTTIRVKVDSSSDYAINTPHNSSAKFTGTFTAEANSTVSVYASFLPMYAITVNSTTNGTVRPNVTEAFYGGEDTLTVTPIEGYSVNSVSVNTTDGTPVEVTESGSSWSFNMPASAVAVGATFIENFTPVPAEHYIYCNAKINGGSVDSDKYAAEKGQTVTITATPNAGYKTVGVYYQKNNNQSGYSWQAASNNGNGTWSFKMPDYDVYVSAIFMLDDPGYDYHYITVSNPGSHCTVDVKNWAYCGEYVTINLSNFDAGYTLSYLKVDGVYVKPYAYNGYLAHTFKMPSHSVAIEVGTTNVSGKYYIDTSYDSTLGGVEVWVNNNYTGNNWHQGSWADHNDTVSFKVKPYYSDDVVSVSVVGKRTGWTYSYDYNSYSGWYTFSMPSEDVTISVDFRSGVHKVYVDTVTDGKLTVSDDWAKYGQIVYITAVPDYGCTLSSLSVRTATGDSVHVYNAQKADTYYFYMPDQYVSVSAVFTGKYTSVPFNDVSYGDWYYNAVQFVYSRGIMDGVDYYKFAPNGTITRGMILTMLWRMAGEPFEMPVTSFTDVEIGRYYTTAVAWACRNGIADGMGESTFGPNDAITREELVTLMYRYAQYFGHSCIGTSIEGFADAGSVSAYAYNAMCWAYKAGVVTGTTGSRLNPQGTASRAEAAQMIMSFSSFLNS